MTRLDPADASIRRWLVEAALPLRLRRCASQVQGFEVPIVSQKSGLTVRQHERAGISVPFELTVCEEHAAQVRFSPASSADGQHSIRGKAIDISSGGMGLECRHFLPRNCEGAIRVYAGDAPAAQGLNVINLELLFEHRVKVRRVSLSGREPSYLIGVAFVDPGSDIDQRITEVLDRIMPLPGSIRAKGAPHA